MSKAGPSGEDNSSSSSFTYGILYDVRDGRTYKSIIIDSVTWMAENLNYEYKEGSARSFCFGDKSSNCDLYGRLYTWSAAMDSAGKFSTSGKGCGYGVECSASGIVQGICPQGWHLPSDSEWSSLLNAAGGENVAGRKLNSLGFSIQFAGARNYFGKFHNLENNAFFWSSSVKSPEFASSWNFELDADDAGQVLYNSDFSFSVRCVKN